MRRSKEKVAAVGGEAWVRHNFLRFWDLGGFGGLGCEVCFEAYLLYGFRASGVVLVNQHTQIDRRFIVIVTSSRTDLAELPCPRLQTSGNPHPRP